MAPYVSHCGKKYPGKSRFFFLLAFAFSVILPTGLANDELKNYASIINSLYVKREIDCEGKHYTLGEELGSGAFGKVFKGNPTSSGEKPVAVKVFYPTSDYEFKHEKSENDILEELEASNIKGFPRFYGTSGMSWFRKESDGTFKKEVRVGDGRSAIVMEIVGETWEDRIKKNSSTSLDWFFPSARQVVQIVMHLGEKEKVHRDIKPENIAFSLDGADVFLLDVAFVKDIGSYKFSGSPKYAAMNWQSQDSFNLNFNERTDLECLGWSMVFMIFDSDRLDDHHAHVMAVANFMQELWSTANPNFDHLELILTNPPEQYNSPAIAGLKSNYNPKKPEELKKQFFAWVAKPKQVVVKIRGDPQFQDVVSLWYDGVIYGDIPKLFKGVSPRLFGKDEHAIVDNGLDEVYAHVTSSDSTPAGNHNPPVGGSSTNGGTPAANPNTLVGGKSQKGGDKSANTGLTTTDIIGIVAGAVAAIVLLGLLVWWLRRRCNSRRAKEEDYLGPEIEGVPSIGYASDIALASRE